MFLCGKVVALYTQKKTKLNWFVIKFWVFFSKKLSKKEMSWFLKKCYHFSNASKSFLPLSCCSEKTLYNFKKLSPIIVKSTLGYSPPIPIAKK
jgi:hypothetical protein